MKSINLKFAVAAALLSASALAFAAPGGGGPGGQGGGGGRGGGGPPNGEEGGNNLSVPTILIGIHGFGVSCGGDGVWSELVPASGVPSDGWPLDAAAFYFVQGVHKWQAPCTNHQSVAVTGAWGDNLAGDAKLQAGKPIRVELVLEEYEGVPTYFGYVVEKLEPLKLDRESAYGTLAKGDPTTGYEAIPTAMVSGVYSAGGKLTVTTPAGDLVEMVNATGEINAKGRVVYGYNLRVNAAGEYLLTYSIPNVDFLGGCDVGTCKNGTAELAIQVIGAGGGGGKKGGR